MRKNSRYLIGLALSLQLIGCAMEDIDSDTAQAEPEFVDEADMAVSSNQVGDDNAQPIPPPSTSAAYNGVCGAGYSVIDSHGVSGGTVYLTFNASNGRNCVVTIRNTPGARVHMCAEVSLAGDIWNIDCGDYTTYAGPVYVTAPHQCIDWGGSIGDSTFTEFGTHCG